MVFKCQEDSFLREYVTKVVSCEAAIEGSGEQELSGYNVICEDTILFPEGGGQPCDYGSINGAPVRKVVRKGQEAIHFVEADKAFEVGEEVLQRVDWERRLDHMQQHSGQHLITALFDQEFGYNTTSWCLGSETSYIELDTCHLISHDSLNTIESKANDLIRQGRGVTVLQVDPEVALEFRDARAPRGLPKDHTGLARVVRIEGIESNMCCGTHVTNLHQLQAIKLLYAEKTKGNVYVHFVVGQRVLKKLDECYQRELQMNLTLKGGPKQHVELIEKLQANVKSSTKTLQKLLKEVAVMEAEKLENSNLPRPKFYTLHRRDCIDPDFCHTFLRHAPEGIFYFLTVSDGQKGHLILRGEPKLIKKFGKEFMDLLDGKGNDRDNSFFGKITNISRISACEDLLREYFEQIP